MRRLMTSTVFRWQLAAVGILLMLLLPGQAMGTAQAQTAEAQTGDQLAGVRGSARASGLYAHYNLGGVLPIASPVDSSAPDASTTISSGPATFAQAGVLNPGDLLANPDVVMQLFLGDDWEPGTIPEWPLRISSTSGFGASTAESDPAPGLSARVEAESNLATATASAGRSDIPSIISVGSVTTESTSTTDGNTVTVSARTEVGGFDLLGILVIESIVTEVSATSDGTDVVLSGETRIGGATLAGQEVVIDGEGMHSDAPDRDPVSSLLGGLLSGLTGSVSDVLDEAGISITAGGVLEQEGTDVGRVAATGLRIDLDITGETAPLLGEVFGLLDQIELPVIDGLPLQIADVLQIVRSRNIVRIELASAEASLAATLAPEIPPFEPPPVEEAAPPATSPPAPPPAPAPDPPPATSPPATSPSEVASPIAPSPAARTSVATLAPGVGVALVLALLAQPFLGMALRWWATRVLAPAAVGGACPRGGAS